MKPALLLLTLTLSACGRAPKDGRVYTSASFIDRGQTLYVDRMESTPVAWIDGSLIDVVSFRGHFDSFGTAIELYRDGALIHSEPSDGGFLSAIVEGGRLYVFTTSNWSRPGNSISVKSSADLVTWSAPVVVHTAPAGVTLFNTSVTKDESGFVMALESCVPGNVCFEVNFLRSSDLLSWSPVGRTLLPGVYTACPTIRFSEGFYYVFYLHSQPNHTWATLVARSADLSVWEFSPQGVLAPEEGEGENTSDLDLVEYGGEVRIRYAIGYQTVQDGAFVHIREASYAGGLSEFLRKFFSSLEEI